VRLGCDSNSVGRRSHADERTDLRRRERSPGGTNDLHKHGHGTLNALLIVSGGATVAFLTFLGNAVQQRDLVSLSAKPRPRTLRQRSGISSRAFCTRSWLGVQRTRATQATITARPLKKDQRSLARTIGWDCCSCGRRSSSACSASRICFVEVTQQSPPFDSLQTN
jgi:hypothetical protein